MPDGKLGSRAYAETIETVARAARPLADALRATVENSGITRIMESVRHQEAAMRAASILGPASPSVPIRTDAVTCPRAIRCRRSSRMSPSSRARPLGVLMLGLKKRWFTERISTAIRLLPIVASALPNPVMLFMR